MDAQLVVVLDHLAPPPGRGRRSPTLRLAVHLRPDTVLLPYDVDKDGVILLHRGESFPVKGQVDFLSRPDCPPLQSVANQGNLVPKIEADGIGQTAPFTGQDLYPVKTDVISQGLSLWAINRQPLPTLELVQPDFKLR